MLKYLYSRLPKIIQQAACLDKKQSINPPLNPLVTIRECDKNPIHLMIEIMISKKLKTISSSRSILGTNFHGTDDCTVNYKELNLNYDQFIAHFKNMSCLDMSEKRKSQKGAIDFPYNGKLHRLCCQTVFSDHMEGTKISYLPIT
jgi:hypothetical protein